MIIKAPGLPERVRRSRSSLTKGPFNNYVEKMRGRPNEGVGGQKMSVFVHEGIKTVHAGGGPKNGKILSTNLLNDP